MKSQLIRFSLILILLEFLLNTSGFAQTFSYINFTISEEPIVIDQTNVPWAGYWPDGKLCFLPETDGSGWVCYWGEGDTFRTKAATTHLEDHIANNNWHLAFGRDVNRIDGFNDGGSWIIGIHRLDNGKLVGFFHAESWWPGEYIAYKSIGVTYSSDNGLTWDPGKRILTSDEPKPQEPAWTGLGDGCVVWNIKRQQYICYYPGDGGITMAASFDPEGAAGTWRKWDGEDFTIEGCNQETQLGGKGVPIKGLESVSGTNPSVMWNEYLNCWLMTYAKWGGDVYLSHSNDGIEWSKPILLLTEPIKPLYPNLVSDKGDVIGGMNIRLYYSRNQGITRELAYRTISIMGLATLDDTFTAAVPCGDGTVNLTFKVTNAMPLEVEVSASPEDIAGALTIPAMVTDENGIEYAVKSIGKHAFDGFERSTPHSITSVTIAEGITTIDYWAFQNCPELETVILPESVENIYGAAFSYSPKLSAINIPTHLKTIYDWVFVNCTALKSIILPEGITVIMNDAFRGSGLESITFPSTLTEVWHGAFCDCKQLASIDFNHCPAYFEYDCFGGCSSLEELYIPNTVQFRNRDYSWAWNIFGYCPSLKTVTFDAFEEGQNRWSTTSLFPYCSALETVVLPSLSVMQQGFFWNCKSLKGITILEIEDDFDARYYSFSKMFSGLNAEDILFHVPAGTAETMLKAGYLNLSDKSGLPIVRTEFEAEAARIATMADALNDGAKASLTRAIANARSAVNAAEDYATVYAQIDAIKTAAKTFLTTATVPSNFDITAVILNPDFEQLQLGWNVQNDWVNYPNVNKRGWNGASYENGEVTIGKFIDTWESTTLQNGDISQTIKALPAGIYRLEADIIASNQNDANAKVTGVSLFAGSQKTAVATKNEKPQHFSIEFTLDETGDCTIGINVNNTNANWVAMDNVRLYCKEMQKDQKATSISLDKTSLTLTAKNQTATLTATVLPSNVTDKSVTWTSSNTSVATVDANGKVTAVANGTATITAKTNDGSNLSAICTVTVDIPIIATSISLNKTSLTFTTKNQTATLTATVLPSNATNKSVTWTSSKTSVATVDSNGKVTAVANGTATITAKTNDGSNLSATCKVTVDIPIIATSISFDKTSLTFTAANQTATLAATVLPSNATNKSVTWTSNKTSVATVDSNGKVTAVANGSATITAKTNDGSNLTATCKVSVDIPEPGVFSNNKLYTLTCKRGGLVMNSEGTGLAAGQTRTDAPEADKRFAIITYNGKYYLYSPTVKQYLLADGSFVNRLGSPITFDDSKADGEYKYMLCTQGTNGETWYFNNNGDIVINGWDAADDGNRWLIEPVADFDPTEALAVAATQTFTVTYEVLYEGKVVATATEKVASGNALPAPPASLKNDYITLTKSGTHPTKVTKDVTVQFTANWNGPFEFSKNVTNAKWYNMHIRSGWYVGKQESEPYYPKQNDGKIIQTAEYLWAFGGDPYHVKVYNYTTGFAETLTKDGENAVMRKGEYAWDLLSNNGGFVLRETGTDYNCINQLGGGGGPLGFWYDRGSLTDDGSTFRVEETMDIVNAIESLTPALSKGEGEIYDLSGRKMSNGRRKGIYIIRMKDGTTKKTMIK